MPADIAFLIPASNLDIFIPAAGEVGPGQSVPDSCRYQRHFRGQICPIKRQRYHLTRHPVGCAIGLSYTTWECRALPSISLIQTVDDRIGSLLWSTTLS